MYLFESVKMGASAKEQAAERETENHCLIYQTFRECREKPRYEITEYSETVSPTTVTHRTRPILRSDAPSCAKCWDKIQRDSDIHRLVDSITTYDLAGTITMAITGEQKEFQEAVIKTCIETECAADVPTIKKILERGLEIRLQQLELMSPEHQVAWDEQATEEFIIELGSFIKKVHAAA